MHKIFYKLFKTIKLFKYFNFFTAFRIILRKTINLNYKSSEYLNEYYHRTLKAPNKIPNFDLNVQYQKWIEKNFPSEKELQKQKKLSKTLFYKPLISIIMPVYNPRKEHLIAAIQSCKNQTYDNWELCIVDDASTDKEILQLLKKYEKEKNIKISYHKKNKGIAETTNDALKLAKGEFIALLDHDDMLSPEALFQVVKVLNENPETDFIYSDEDKISPEGLYILPFFKPNWAPDTFYSVMYTCHLGVYRKSIVDKIGGFRKGFEGAQDYDFVLRFIENTSDDKIFHIPKILYHWRMANTSTALNPKAKTYAYDSAKKAIKESLKRKGYTVKVEDGICIGNYRVRYIMKKEPLIAIIIPNRNSYETIKRCLDSIKEKTSYKNYKIYIIDHQSSDSRVFDLYKKHNCEVIPYSGEFNFAKMNNLAVSKVKEEYILFLNNDTQVISEDWLKSMVEFFERPDIAIVGAKLLYPDNTIQHGGLILGINNLAGSCCKCFPIHDNGYFNFLSIIKNCSAVTAACMLIRKKVFEEVGGFDEENFRISFNDVDLCLRVREKGYLIVYTPYALLYHWESKTRGYNNNPRERIEEENLRKKWKHILRNDPYYNPNLTLTREDYSLRIE